MELTKKWTAFAPVWWQVKDNNGEEGDCDARYDEVDGMEESLAADGDVEGDIWLRLGAAVEALDVFARRHAEYVPLNAHVEVFQVNALFNDVRDSWPARPLVNMDQINLWTYSHEDSSLVRGVTGPKDHWDRV